MESIGVAMQEGEAKGKGTVGRFDKWIPWYFVAFFVGLAILDGIFVFVATSTHTGVVTENAYQKGLDYNDTIEAARVQEGLGWSASIAYNDGSLSINLNDDAGQAIENAAVEAVFFRPTQDGLDFNVRLLPVGSGHYANQVSAQEGQWDVRVYVTWQQKHFQTARRIVVPKQ